MTIANMELGIENLYALIQFCLKLPISSCTIDRTFSKSKIMKSTIHTTMEGTQVESLLIISRENDVNIDIFKVFG